MVYNSILLESEGMQTLRADANSQSKLKKGNKAIGIGMVLQYTHTVVKIGHVINSDDEESL